MSSTVMITHLAVCTCVCTVCILVCNSQDSASVEQEHIHTAINSDVADSVCCCIKGASGTTAIRCHPQMYHTKAQTTMRNSCHPGSEYSLWGQGTPCGVRVLPVGSGYSLWHRATKTHHSDTCAYCTLKCITARSCQTSKQCKQVHPVIADQHGRICESLSGVPHSEKTTQQCHGSLIEDLPDTEPWGVETAAAMTASVALTDMPTSAAESAARSLIPSPQNMVVFPRPCANTSSWLYCHGRKTLILTDLHH